VKFALAEEQELLRDSVERFVSERYRFADSQRSIVESLRIEPRTWRYFAEQGWLSLPLPSEYGGLDGSAADLGVLMEALGHGPVLEPYLPVAVVAAGLLALLGSDAQKDANLPPIASGKKIVVLAHHESTAGQVTESVTTRANRRSDGWVLNGAKISVAGGYAADSLIVSARIAGNARDSAGVGLFLVDATTPGLVRHNYPTLDGACGSDIDLAEVRVPAESLIGGSDNALPALERICDRAIAALAAQAVGSAQRLVDMTIEYASARVQFGRALVSNQVIRHRLVDMSIACLEARAAALHAAQTMNDEPIARARAASSAKWKVAHSARFIAEQAVQIHGAIGCTDELPLGRYYRSIIAFEQLYGSPDRHLDRHAALRPRCQSAAAAMNIAR
jgi:alkylation response protein AidB-like acyl-CoA dehydrogenase